MESKLTFNELVASIQQVHEQLTAQASKAVNISLTIRNWLVGLYIAEYELQGADRAKYGDNLLSELAKRLSAPKISNCNRRQLYRYLRFYRLYPQIVGTLSPQLKKLLPAGGQALEKVGSSSPQLRTPPEKLIHRLSYSHIEMIVDLDDELKRAFYEIECIRGNWSVRENARAQIRVIVKRILRKYGYPPDKQEKANRRFLNRLRCFAANGWKYERLQTNYWYYNG